MSWAPKTRRFDLGLKDGSHQTKTELPQGPPAVRRDNAHSITGRQWPLKELGIDRQEVIRVCLQEGVPIYQGKIDKTLFQAQLQALGAMPQKH